MWRLFITLSATLLAANAGDYVTSIDAWRSGYEKSLKAPNGWLSVAGLSWLREGVNRVGSAEGNEIRLPARCPRDVGAFEFHSGSTTLRVEPGVSVKVNGKVLKSAELKGDKSQAPDIVETCDVALTVIERGKRFGIRMRDPRAESLLSFKGLDWFPIDESYRVLATWHAYEKPKMIPITNILGDTEDEASPGYADFSLNGKHYRLEPVIEDPGELFFLFKDLTSARETYGAGRFLKSAMPKNGTVELDFNKAYNPPCAYIAFATCPLPPKQNRLDMRVEAGQKRYGH